MVELNESWGVTLTDPVGARDAALACADRIVMKGSSQSMAIVECVCCKKEWMTPP